MQRIFLVVALAIGLSGCAGLGTGISLITKSVANPVTTSDLYQAESGFRIVVAGLAAYKKACAQNAADKNCRANVATIQTYTRQIPPYLTQIRTFLRNNDQINAINTYNALTALIAQARTTAVNLGVNIGA